MSANMTTPHLPGKFIWFEHVSADIAKARAFYEPLFGWHVEAMPMGGSSYSMILNSGGQGIGGFAPAQAGEAAHWLSHLSVPDVDKSFQAALANGAKQVTAPTDFPPVGRGAVITDPVGATVSLWRSANGDRPDVPQVPPGDWVWNELWSRDAKKALAFYEKTFGHTHDAMDMGEQGTYWILKSQDQGRAGVFEATDPKIPPMWLPYVNVSDTDASAAKAAKLGAKVFMPPTDIPNVGRFAAMFDPLGAPIAIIKPQPRS
jgi:predicted enzyme related to lactoylglutathione lyase